MKISLQNIVLRLAAVALSILLAACNDSSGSNGGGEACFTGLGKSQVMSIMEEWYLWNDEAEQFNKYRDIDPNGYSDADELLSALRYQPLKFDRGFSYITTPEEEAAFFGEGEFIGFGFGMVQIGNEIRFSFVYPDSPAAEAGFERGFRLLEINGRSIAQIEAAEGLSAALGPPEVGFTLSFTVADTGDVEHTENLSKAVVTIDPVPVVTTLADGGGEVGYILFNTFITSASNELRAAFGDFKTDNISRVIIDLRYNGGGLVSVAEVLASLLAGPVNVDMEFSTTIFNSAHVMENKTTVFQMEANALPLSKIVFITSEGSASASELVINGLKPYFSDTALAQVGSPTYGKPVGQFGFDFCNNDFRLRAVTFKSINADDEGDYFNGLSVDCPAADDLLNPLGDANEASLAEALAFVETGACSIAAAPGFTISSAKARARPVTGPGLAQQYAGAF